MTEFLITYISKSETNEIVAQNETGDVVGEIEYTRGDNFWSIIHTGVRPAYRGGPIARTLVRKVVEAAREEGVKVGSTCSYAIKVLEETLEFSDIFTPAEKIITYSKPDTTNQILAKNLAGETVGHIDYTPDTDSWEITHTEVEEAYRGGDIARTLVRKTVEAAREANVKLTATCPYASKVLTRTPEYHDVFTPKE